MTTPTLKEIAEPNSLENLANKAITCLYICVDSTIADDVKQRVGAFVCQLKREKQELTEAVAAVKNELDGKYRSCPDMTWTDDWGWLHNNVLEGVRNLESRLAAVTKERDELRAELQKRHDLLAKAFGQPRGENGQCQCAYCRRDFEAITEHAACLEMENDSIEQAHGMVCAERDQLKRENEELRQESGALHSCSNECQRPACVNRRKAEALDWLSKKAYSIIKCRFNGNTQWTINGEWSHEVEPSLFTAINAARKEQL